MRQGQGLQFPFGNQRASSNDPPSVFNNKHVVASILLANPFEAVGELGFGDISDGSKNTQALEETGMVVGLAQGA